MFYYLNIFKDSDWVVWKAFNVLRYITVRGTAAAATAFLIMLIFGPYVIRRLQKEKIGEDTGKSDSDKLNSMHKSKNGTPTMGGVLMLAAVVAAVMLWARPDVVYVPLILAAMGAFAIVGYADDFIKLRCPGKKGLTIRTKLMLQLAIGFVVGLLLYGHFSCSTSVVEPESIRSVPAFATADMVADVAHELSPQRHREHRDKTTTRIEKEEIDSPRPLHLRGEESVTSPGTAVYFPFFKDLKIQLGLVFVLYVMIVLTGSSNAVNLTDGLDGLAIGCLVMVSMALGVVAYVVGRADFSAYLGVPHVPGAGEIAVICAAMMGASLGFLWFNCHPAQIFMGDIGALSFGGAVGLVALMLKQEFMLVIVGGIFVLEALSVIMQVASYRLTGKRIFAIAPLHHHFEAAGWHENKVTVRFWIIAAMLALLSVATLKLR